MMRQMVLCPTLVLFLAATGVAQPPSKQPSSATVTDIRKVDFLNSTYPSALCSQEYGEQGIGKTVRVRNGEFKKGNVYFSVSGSAIIYADVTGDGKEDAIVPIDCGAIMANFSLSEIYIYTIQSGQAKLLAEISDKDMERDYRRHYPDAESYWGMNENGLKARDGHLEIEVLADGSHASPQYIATLKYGLSGKTFGLVGKPQRSTFRQ